MSIDDAIPKISANVAELYQAIRSIDPGTVPAITRFQQVDGQLTGLLFSIHQIGLTLEAIGGPSLVQKVILGVEEQLDDVLAAVFLNRRWDGYPRS